MGPFSEGRLITADVIDLHARKRGQCIRAGGRHLKPDGLEPFRLHMGWLRARCKRSGVEFTVDEHDLKRQWDKQRGLCPYTGWAMLNPDKPARVGAPLPKVPHRASLDRVDPSRGYVPGNVAFIALLANYAKNDWDSSVVVDFAQAVAAHQAAKLKQA